MATVVSVVYHSVRNFTDVDYNGIQRLDHAMSTALIATVFLKYFAHITHVLGIIVLMAASAASFDFGNVLASARHRSHPRVHHCVPLRGQSCLPNHGVPDLVPESGRRGAQGGRFSVHEAGTTPPARRLRSAGAVGHFLLRGGQRGAACSTGATACGTFSRTRAFMYWWTSSAKRRAQKQPPWLLLHPLAPHAKLLRRSARPRSRRALTFASFKRGTTSS